MPTIAAQNSRTTTTTTGNSMAKLNVKSEKMQGSSYKIPTLESLQSDGPIECALSNFQLLNSPLFNKGTAFTESERDQFNLHGLLPPQVDSLEEQLERAYKQLSGIESPIQRNDYMSRLRVTNKVLYFALVKRHINELVPIIYTPTEGDAIAGYSERLRKVEGVFLDITRPDTIDQRLTAFGGKSKDIDYIVVSDSEGILGIGDQGVGGVRIAISKLALMTLCGGIHPGKVLPVCLDVGTNNKKLLDDELYLGNRFPRVRGEKYYDFVDKFIKSVKKNFPRAVLHFEDFGVTTARTLLDKYRSELPCFNDDIQGTGAVVVASLLSALKHTHRSLNDSKILIYGAGSAGLGIAVQIVNHMVTKGLTIEQARSHVYLMDRYGLITTNLEDVSSPAQFDFAKPANKWENVNTKSLFDVVSSVQPTCLVGCSTQAKAFTKDVVQEMHKYNERPIIFPLSNPTRLHEAVPQDLMDWTNNQALVATGSPFNPVNGYIISQNNNCYSFPGIGLGAVLSKATTISDKMISAAVDELANLSELKEGDSTPGLLPGLEQINDTSARLAAAVVLEAINENVHRCSSDVPREKEACIEWVKTKMWEPKYRSLIRVQYDESIHTNQI
ncbi:hypothetical protein KAFR_0D03620 [Kazachstania africana CBS 2517]|uniref:Malic enzyme n=1 Tax=Kazachstania africana (strain ATCC 22294 / BCRC 22015 / CBS 2517 / CECT 1963 / NBRC 1671 / NRRL Y-8276) TaxID=1071382 RepID=H2AUG0_KAZAF|nr:hypothetical protein KAFR_0D03620 [Kazachstania africana CBS 2517]CCF58010.1 hypothetical protein KAFR_0D03620 [Kazachstania africana CBS 2517]